MNRKFILIGLLLGACFAFTVLQVATVEAQISTDHPCYDIEPDKRDGHACWPAGEDPSVSVESSGESGDGGAGALENAAISGGLNTVGSVASI